MSAKVLEDSRKLDELAEKYGGYVVMGRGDDTRSGVRAISDYVKKTKEPLPLSRERMMEIDELLMAQ
jgi:hypothetical protein